MFMQDFNYDIKSAQVLLRCKLINIHWAWAPNGSKLSRSQMTYTIGACDPPTHVHITFVQESRMNMCKICSRAVKDTWPQTYAERGCDCHDYENKNKQTTASTRFFISAPALVRHTRNMVQEQNLYQYQQWRQGSGSHEFYTSHPLTRTL